MDLDFEKLGGLVAAVVQDGRTSDLLMVGFMNEAAFHKTVETGWVTFFSRSRGTLWTKGETSGHRLRVLEIVTDCDRDALLVRVEPIGPGVCHDGYRSCFHLRLEDGRWVETEPAVFDAGSVYGARS